MEQLRLDERSASRWGGAERDRPDARIEIAGHECAYCGADIPVGAKTRMARLSFGFGHANKQEVYFCSAVHRGLFFERGPESEPAERSTSPGLNRQLSEFVSEGGQQRSSTALRA